MINKKKSSFIVPDCAFENTVRRIKRLTSFTQQESPMTYLGCPIYLGRQNIVFYSKLISNIVARIKGWHTKMLSYGGKVVLIKHVLQSMPIHLLSVVVPPNTIIKQVQGLLAEFFLEVER